MTEPIGTEVLFENDRVRVWEMVLQPGETCAPHRHHHDDVIIYPDTATMRTEDGAVLQVDPGLVACRLVGRTGMPPHTITNVGAAPARHYIIELLGPSAAETTQPLQHNGRGRPVAGGGAGVS
jgi:hypothetical protein